MDVDPLEIPKNQHAEKDAGRDARPTRTIFLEVGTAQFLDEIVEFLLRKYWVEPMLRNMPVRLRIQRLTISRSTCYTGAVR